MKRRAVVSMIAGIMLFAAMPAAPSAVANAAELQAATLKAWAVYVEATERRIAAELVSGRGFLAFEQQPEAQQVRQAVIAGEIPVQRLETFCADGAKIDIPGGRIHHWRGCVFIPGIDLARILARVTNPLASDTSQEDVLESHVLERGPDSLRIQLKLQRTKFITVVYNTEHKVEVHRLGKKRATSTSVATRIAELEMTRSGMEREKAPGEDHGFLWRLNSYWRYEQTDGGVIVECESISLSRTVPAFLELGIRPLIDSTARESMRRTLGAMRSRMAAPPSVAQK